MYPVVTVLKCVSYKNIQVDNFFFIYIVTCLHNIHRTMQEWYMYSVLYIGKYIVFAMATGFTEYALHVAVEFILE